MSARRLQPLAFGLFVVSSLLLGAVYVLFAGTTVGLELDDVVAHSRLFDSVQRPPQLLSALLSDPITLLIAAALVALALACRRWREALGVVVIVAGSAGTASALKSVLASADPLGGEAARTLGPGFYPSGHAAAAMAIALGALLVAPAWRRQLMLLGGVWCSIHGVMILVDRQHHFSDVVGGFLLAGAVASLVVIVPWPRTPAATEPARLPAGAIVKLLAVVIVVPALIEAVHLAGLAIEDRLHVLLIVGTVLAALAFVLVASYALLLDRPAQS